MILDFKEIPTANQGGREQDIFELFACDFFESLGYEIVSRPDRGADGKKDLIIKSKGGYGTTAQANIKWLVSCKHNAHSGKSVSDNDETDITDRLRRHKCQGFICFYSTLPSSSLNNKLHSLENLIFEVYDYLRIEKELLNLSENDILIKRYFPKSHKNTPLNNTKLFSGSTQKRMFSEEEIIQLTKTAIIELELTKIDLRITSENWTETNKALNELSIYTLHTNSRISSIVINLLANVSNLSRHSIPESIITSIHSLLITYMPHKFEENENNLDYRTVMQSLYVGYSIAYDAFIYLNNYRIAMWGLNIWKHVYRHAKKNGHNQLIEEVFNNYKDIEETLNRPERNDLEEAKQLVEIFKADLEERGMAFPVLPNDLYATVERQKVRYKKHR